MYDRSYYVYILTNRTHQTLYIGMTNSMRRRLEEHRQGVSTFTEQYSVRKLVYYEIHHDVNDARQRERSLKRWLRAWKEALISEMNPDWVDLSEGLPFD